MKIKSRQLCFFFISFLPIVKMFSMPQLLSFYAERDLIWSFLLTSLIDIALLLIILTKANKEQTYYNLLKENYGKSVAKITYFLFFLFFIFKAFIPINEQKSYVGTTLYETSPNVFTFLPFFIICVYICFKDANMWARVSDIMVFLTLFSIFLIFCLSLLSADYSNLFPLFGSGFKPVLKGSYFSLTYMGDSLYLLFFLGLFKSEKHLKTKVVLSYILSTVLVCVFLAIYYGIFSYISVRQLYAINEVSKYSVFISNTVRFDYIAIFLEIFASIFSLVLPVYFATKCLDMVFPFKTKWQSVLISNSLLLIPFVFFTNSTFIIQSFIIKNLSFVFLIFVYAIPLLTILFMKKEKRHASFKS